MFKKLIVDENEKMVRFFIKSGVIVLLSPLFITINMYYFINYDVKLYNVALELFTAVLAFSLGIIAVIKNSKYSEKLYKMIGCGFLIIGIIKFINVIIINMENFELQYQYRFIMEFDVFFIIYIALILAFNSEYNKIKEKRLYKIYSCLIVLFSIAIPIIINITAKYSISKYVVSCLLIILLVLAILEIINPKYKLSIYERYMFIIYISIVGVTQMIYIYSFIKMKELYIIEPVLKYLSTGIMYIILETNFYYKSYESEKKLLEESKVRKQSLNEILKIRNKELIKIKSNIEKSEKKQRSLLDDIKDLVIMVSFGRVSYINKAARNVLDFDAEIDNYIGIGIEEFVELLLIQKVFSYNIVHKIRQLSKSSYYERKLYKLFDIRRNECDYEIYYVKLNNIDELFYVKDVTYINENEKLRKSYEKYIKEEQLKDEFYSNISHELRTPINLIFSALQVNGIYLNDKNNNAIAKNNRTIKQNCLRLIRTINNFIDANKISEGYFIPNKQVYNIVDIVENISLACKKYIDRIENTIVFDSVGEEIYAKVDRDMIERIMLNILSNCVKYGKNGATILVNINIIEDKIQIIINNNLYMINETIRPYIFDKFSKLNRAFNREKEGSGLGLFLAKALIELNDGTIEVNSSIEEGTEFIITIPVYITDSIVEETKIVELESISEKVDTEFSDIYF
jgi:signal transduction histidine kinase